jgi:inner membrane protein
MADFAGSADNGMIQALGWFGSALVVASLALHRPVPFRLVNLASAVVLLTFNLAIGLWSMVVLNVAILAVNVWQLRKLARRSPVLDPAPPEEGWFIRPRERVDQNAARTL